MSKPRRDKKKLRPHELTDDDFLTVDKEPEVELVRAPLRSVKPASPEVRSLYREGQVVYVPVGKDSRVGTVVQLTDSEAWVLDTLGYLHVVRIGELGSA